MRTLSPSAARNTEKLLEKSIVVRVTEGREGQEKLLNKQIKRIRWAQWVIDKKIYPSLPRLLITLDRIVLHDFSILMFRWFHFKLDRHPSTSRTDAVTATIVADRITESSRLLIIGVSQSLHYRFCHNTKIKI